MGGLSILQDSQNLGFNFWQTIGDANILPFDPFANGTYDLSVRIETITGDPILSADMTVEVFTNGCTDTVACNYDVNATDNDGSCEYLTCAGCTTSGACNYDASATIDDGSCEFTSCAGCTDINACNYDASATIDDGSCLFTGDSCDDGDPTTVNDTIQGDCSCAGVQQLGCTDDTACNYNANATADDGSCEFTSCAGCTNQNACNYDSTATIDNGSCEFISCAGCTNQNACNYDPTATIDDNSCLILAGDFNNDGIVNTSDLTILLGNWGCTGANCIGDMNGDQQINSADLTLFLPVFGSTCGDLNN
jgi:hypothetical protein